MKKENAFQPDLIDEIKMLFPGSVVFKNDPLRQQGVPDLLILYGNKWAMLECKKSADAPYRPNQEYRINKYNKMSYAHMICPENKEEVLHEMERSFKA